MMTKWLWKARSHSACVNDRYAQAFADGVWPLTEDVYVPASHGKAAAPGMTLNGAGMARLWCLAAVLFLFLEIWASPLAAHHPGGISGAKVLVEGSQGGYNVTLEVSPGDFTAEIPIEFFLWVTPVGMGQQYTGEARLWLRGEDPASPAARTMIPLVERDRGMAAVVYSAPYRIDRQGTYRVEVDLPNLQARWEGSVRVDKASSWFFEPWTFIAFAGLVGAFVVFLEWRQRRKGKTS